MESRSATTQPELKERIAMATEGITKENANKVLIKSLEMYWKHRKAGDLTLSMVLAALMAKYQCEFLFHKGSLRMGQRSRIGKRESQLRRGHDGKPLLVDRYSPDGISINPIMPRKFKDIPGWSRMKYVDKCRFAKGINEHVSKIKIEIWQEIAATEKEMAALIAIRDERRRETNE